MVCADHELVNAQASAQQLFKQQAFLVAILRQRLDNIRLFTGLFEQRLWWQPLDAR